MSDKKKKFHLTVTDNETGEAIHETDINAMIGAVHLGEGFAQGMCLAGGCNLVELAETVKGAEETLERVYKEDPMLRLLTSLMDGKIEENKEAENKEE